MSDESPDSDGFKIFHESLQYATQKPKDAVLEEMVKWVHK